MQKDGRLVQSNDSLIIKSMETIVKIPILMTYLLNIINGCSQKYQRYCLFNMIVERLKVSLIKQSFDNIKCESNLQNIDFYDLPVYGDQKLITRR